MTDKEALSAGVEAAGGKTDAIGGKPAVRNLTAEAANAARVRCAWFRSTQPKERRRIVSDYDLHVSLIERQESLTVSQARAMAYVEGPDGLLFRMQPGL
nr:MAG: hypothetical protein [Microvirus sp.]